jgi:hypothetical protein
LKFSAILLCVNLEPEHNLFRLSDLRFARLLHHAAESHRGGDFPASIRDLAEADKLLAGDKDSARIFLRAWREAIHRQQRGLPLAAAPSAWESLAQAIAARIERGEAYETFLEAKLVRSARIRQFWRRTAFGLIGAAAFIAGFTVVAFVLRGAIAHFDLHYRSAQLPFFRRGIWLYVHALATLVWGGAMALYGFRWIRLACENDLRLAPKFDLRAVETGDPSRAQ